MITEPRELSDKGLADVFEVPIPCQGCGGVAAKVSIRNLKLGQVITCACGATTEIKGSDPQVMADSLDGVDRAAESLGKVVKVTRKFNLR